MQRAYVFSSPSKFCSENIADYILPHFSSLPAPPAPCAARPISRRFFSVVAVSTPTGGVACLSHPSGDCLASVTPRSSSAAAAAAGDVGDGSAAILGAGIAGVALRGSWSGCGKMEVREFFNFGRLLS